MKVTHEQRLKLHGITDEIRADLRRAGAIIIPRMEELLEGFYAFIKADPALVERFPNADSMRRARNAQKAHWTRMFAGTFDAEYLAGAERIGEVHHRIGLEPCTYVAFYSRLEVELQRLILDHGRSRVGRYRMAETLSALQAMTIAKNMDIEITVTAMIDAQHRDFEIKLAEMAKTFEASIGGVSQSVMEAVTHLSTSADSMKGSTGTALTRADSAASAVRAAVSSLISVSAAAEELQASITAINERSKEASSLSHQGAAQAAETNALMQALKSSGDEISGVVELISDVASQTNLLALNASVEAARAGMAGKGFAVVASEVKQLSLRISEATEDISRRIGRMQDDTSQAVKAIRSITGTLEKMSDISSAISVSIEEQRLATEDIARNVTDTAQTAEHLTQDIEGAETVIRSASDSTMVVVDATQQLSQHSGTLNSEVGKFLDGFRAA
ncbi:protoglobin domain-containing protein [Pseudooceanicola sp.]